MTAEQRLRVPLAIDLEAPCWIFQGCKVDGYGRIRPKSVAWAAHRYIWTLMRGPIPPKMTLDHLCRNRACVNPQHLEVVTNKTNVLRGIGPSAINARRTHCTHGHALDEANTLVYPDGHRKCLTCRRDESIRHNRLYRERNRDREIARHRLNRARKKAERERLAA